MDGKSVTTAKSAKESRQGAEMTPSLSVTEIVIQRLDAMDKKLSSLETKIDNHCENQAKFMIDYTKGHSDLEAYIKMVDEKSDRAHERIDAINKLAWALVLPAILSSIAFLWGILNHTIIITMP